MTDDQKYLTERFLAAYDAAQAHFQECDAIMDEAVNTRSSRHCCTRLRRFIVAHMAARDGDGRRLKHCQIGETLGIDRTQVEGLLYRARLEEAAA